MSLNILTDVIIEELERKKQAIVGFDNVLNMLSYCGNLNVKTIKGKSYGYVKYRSSLEENPKLICVGNIDKISEEKMAKINKEIYLWNLYNDQKEEVKEDIKKLEKVIKVLV